MSMTELQKQTNANIQAKANLIWEIATHLVGLFKPHEYGKVILPMTVQRNSTHSMLRARPGMEFCAVSPALISIIPATTILQS